MICGIQPNPLVHISMHTLRVSKSVFNAVYVRMRRFRINLDVAFAQQCSHGYIYFLELKIPGPCSYIHIASVCQTICLSLSTGLETKAPFAPRPLTMTNGKVTLKNAGSECGIIDQPRLNCLCVCVCLRTCDTNARHAIKAKQFIKSVEYVNRNGKKNI